MPRAMPQAPGRTGRIRELSFGTGCLAGGALPGKFLLLLTPGLHSSQGEAFLASLGRSRAVSPSVSWPGFIFLHGTPCHLQFYVSDYLFIISLFLECELRDSGRAYLVPLLQAQQFFVL